MNYKLMTIILCIVFAAGILTGCASQDEDVHDLIATDVMDTQVLAVSSDNSALDICTLNTDDMFTDRDKEIGYDETSSIKISLKDSYSTSNSSSVNINGDTVTISDEGTYILTGNLTNGQIIVNADDSSKVRLVFDNVNINCNTGAAIYVKNADKVFITLAPDSINSLSNADDFVSVDDNNIDSVIFSKSVLTLNGNGSLSINAVYGHGITSKDDLKFAGGTYVVSAASSALSGKDSVRIADGEFNITAGKDGIHSENTDNKEKGFIYISGGNFIINADSDGLDSSALMQIDGGTFNIAAADDAFHSDTDLIVNGGDIDISTSYEGMEGQTLTINDGTINLCSTDDGFNAAGNESCGITINGGIIYINADGDGIDSNGNLAVNGGEIYISGPTSNDDGPLDYNGNAKITNGIVVAAGLNRMAQNFGSESTQGSILLNLSAYADEKSNITLKDSDGNILISYTAEKKYNSVLVSCPEIIDGGTYIVTADGNETTVTMDGLIYGNGMGEGFGAHFGNGPTPPEMPEDGFKEMPDNGFKPHDKTPKYEKGDKNNK